MTKFLKEINKINTATYHCEEKMRTYTEVEIDRAIQETLKIRPDPCFSASFLAFKSWLKNGFYVEK
jgi:hypothetical protein